MAVGMGATPGVAVGCGVGGGRNRRGAPRQTIARPKTPATTSTSTAASAVTSHRTTMSAVKRRAVRFADLFGLVGWSVGEGLGCGSVGSVPP